MPAEFAVPSSLDEIPQVLFLDMYQLVGIVLLISLGLVAGSILTGLLIGLLFARLYSCLRAGRHPQFLVHMAYWYLPPSVMTLKGLPPSHQRLYIG